MSEIKNCLSVEWPFLPSSHLAVFDKLTGFCILCILTCNSAPLAKRGDVEKKKSSDGVRWCMLIYSKAREQSPEAANAVLQIEIADGLWCDRWPKVRHLVIYLSHIPSSLLLRGGAGQAQTRSTSLGSLALALTLWLAQEPSLVCAGKHRTHSPAPLAVKVSNIQMRGQGCRSSWQTSHRCWSAHTETLFDSDLIVFVIFFFWGNAGPLSSLPASALFTHTNTDTMIPALCFLRSHTLTCCAHLHIYTVMNTLWAPQLSKAEVG